MSKVILKGKVGLITGASSGIGRATSILFSKLGSNLILCGRNIENLETVAEECRKRDVEVLTIQGDVSKEEDIKNTVETAMRYYNKRLDVLVNCAGIIGLGTIENTNPKDFDNMMNVNLRSVFQFIQLSIPYLEKNKGAIVNVSSITGIRSFPNVISYCTSKAGVDQLTACSALDLAPKQIRVNAVNPGVIITELQKRGGLDDQAYAEFLERSKQSHALGRPGEVDEVAQTIAFLSSPASSFITGVSLPVDGGRHAMCPR